MLTLMKHIRLICSRIDDKEYAKVLATFLGFVLCKQVNYNSLGVVWHPGREALAHSLSFRTPTLAYNYAECNPFQKVSGSLDSIIESIVVAIDFASLPQLTAKSRLASVLHLSENKDKFDLIITDPPYMDDVPYGELAISSTYG